MEIKDFKDKHENEPCFILGTGPSLSDVDPSVLNDKITLGMSRVMLYPDLHLKYYCVEAERTVRQAHHDIWDLKCDAKFIPYRFKGYDLGVNVVSVNFPHSYGGFPKFSFDCAEIVYWGCNVLYMALQLAAYMGCNPLYLIGVDWHRTGEEMKLHFHDPGIIGEYDPPNVNVQNKGMEYAAAVLSEHGTQVYNLCPTSYLDVFPKKELSDVL